MRDILVQGSNPNKQIDEILCNPPLAKPSEFLGKIYRVRFIVRAYKYKMSIRCVVFAAVALIVLSARANDQTKFGQLTALRGALSEGGVAGLLNRAKAERLRSPEIVSQWYVDSVGKPEQRPAAQAAREFGKAVVVKLAELAPKLQVFAANGELYEITDQLCELAIWCGGTEGYGNLLLAERATDLAAVGVARLTANLDFPLQKCRDLLAKLNEPWDSAELRVRVLNREAGAEIFNSTEQSVIEQIWATGWLLRLAQMNPQVAGRVKRDVPFQILETPAMSGHLVFFDDLDVSQVKPYVLLSLWDLKNHSRIARRAFGSQNLGDARSLLEFREAVGSFPLKSTPITLSEDQKKAVDWEKEYNAKHGRTPVESKPYPQPEGERAFEQAVGLDDWGKLSAEEGNRRIALAVRAWRAYDRVQNGRFWDYDTESSRSGTR